MYENFRTYLQTREERNTKIYKMWKKKNNFYVNIYPTHPHKQEGTQVQFFLREGLTCLNSKFSFP